MWEYIWIVPHASKQYPNPQPTKELIHPSFLGESEYKLWITGQSMATLPSSLALPTLLLLNISNSHKHSVEIRSRFEIEHKKAMN